MNPKLFRKLITGFLSFTFLTTSIVPPSFAQNMIGLPVPGTVINLTPPFSPSIIRGIMIHPEDSLKLDFIVDHGNSDLKDEASQEETKKLVKYFLASLTTPETEMWVNLSPAEKNRIIPKSFGQTEMGRDLLAQDYMLKQLTASLMSPENDLGKAFWEKIYAQAQNKFGTNEIPQDTMNKVWIVPDTALVYENEKGAFIVKTHLKVMMEEEYLSQQPSANSHQKSESSGLKAESQEILKQILIPAIEREVNEGQTFANLRQIYYSMILASWYKKALKESLLGKVYVDQGKVKGVDITDKEETQKIYGQYLEAFKKGVNNYIAEEYDPDLQQVIARKYFTGGVGLTSKRASADRAMFVDTLKKLSADRVTIGLREFGGNQAGRPDKIEPPFKPSKAQNKNVDVAMTADLGPRIPLNYVPITIQNLRDFTGFPGGVPLYLLESILRDSKQQIIDNAVERARRFIAQKSSDEFVFDLSDPVAPYLKPLAREIVVEVLRKVDFKDLKVTIRLNDDGKELDLDLSEVVSVVPEKINNVFFAVRTAEDVEYIDRRLKRIFAQHNLADDAIHIMAFLSYPDSYVNADAIATASNLTSAVMMSYTVAGDLGIRQKPGESLWDRNFLRLQRAQALMAVHKANSAREEKGNSTRIQLIGHVIIFRMNDEAHLRDVATKARESGVDGIRALNPLQARIFHEVFGQPSILTYEEKIAAAEAAIAQAKREGWVVPPEAKEYEYTKKDYDTFLDILDKLQHAQLNGEGGTRYNVDGSDRWVDPYPARNYMLILAEAYQKGLLKDPAQKRKFEIIEGRYGKYWRDHRLLQVNIAAILDKARKDFHKVDSLNFESAKIVRAFEEIEDDGENKLKIKILQALEQGIFIGDELTYAQKSKTEEEKIQRLAARLAAKKAVLHALLSHPKLKKEVKSIVDRIGENGIFKLIEIHRLPDTDRKPWITLHGELQALVNPTHDVLISLTHDHGAGVAIAYVEEKGKKLKRYGIDLATKDGFGADFQKDKFIVGLRFTEEEIKWIEKKAGKVVGEEEKAEKEEQIMLRRAYYYSLFFAFKEAAYKAIGDQFLGWLDAEITEDDGKYFITINPAKMLDAPPINLRVLDFSSERSGRTYVAAEAIFDPQLQSQTPRQPTLSAGSFRNRTKNRAQLAQHVASVLEDGNLYIVPTDDPIYEWLEQMAKKSEVFAKALRLIRTRGLDVLIAETNIEKMDQKLKTAADSRAIQQIVGEFAFGFVNITLGKDEIDELGMDLPLSENSRGVVIINGGLRDNPNIDDLRFTPENPDREKIKYTAGGNLLTAVSELLNEAGHADNPSSPREDDSDQWLIEYKEEAASVMAQLEPLINADIDDLKNADFILSNKDDRLISGKNITDTLPDHDIKWIFYYHGRVVLNEGYNNFPILLAKRFREGGDLQSEYSPSTGFSDKAIAEILKVLKENDIDFSNLNIDDTLQSTVAEVRGQYDNLKQALEDPSVSGFVRPEPVPLTREQRLSMMPRGDQVFNYSESKYLNYRSALAVDMLDDEALSRAREAKAEAVITSQVTADLTKLGQSDPNIILQLPQNEEDWRPFLEQIKKNADKQPTVKALVVDPIDILQLRQLDQKLIKIEKSNGWVVGTIGIILRPTTNVHVKELLESEKSTPRVVGVIVTEETRALYAVAKAHNLAVISEEDRDYQEKFGQQYEGVITKTPDNIAGIKEAFTPTRELIEKKMIDAERLMDEKSVFDISDKSMDDIVEYMKGKATQIEDALWLPIFALRLKLINPEMNWDLEPKITKLRMNSYFNPGMKRTVDYHDKENITDLFEMFSSKRPNQKFIYVTGYNKDEASGELTPIEVEVPVQSLWKEINQIANYLYDQGIRKGDRVTVFMPNSVQFFAALMAIGKIGAVAVNMEVGIKERQLTDGLRRSNVKAIFFGDPVRKDLDRIAEGYFITEQPTRDIQLSTRDKDDFLTKDNFLTKDEYEEVMKVYGDVLTVEKGADYIQAVPHLIQVDIDDVLPESMHAKRSNVLPPIAGVAVKDYRTAMAEGSEENPVELHGIKVGRHDLFIEQYTSGSTGQPKRTAHTHETWMTAALATAEFFLDPDGRKTSLTVLPAVHVYGLNSMFFVPMVTGSSTYVLPQHPEKNRKGEYAITAARILLSGKVRRLLSVPAVLDGLTKYLGSVGLSRDELREQINLDLIVSRGSELSPEVANFIYSVFHKKAANGLGTSEAPNFFQQGLMIVEGTIGVPVLDGEVRLRGENSENIFSIEGSVLPTLGSTGTLGMRTKGSFWENGYIDDGDGAGRQATAEAMDAERFIFPGDVVWVRWDGYPVYLNRTKDAVVDDNGNRIPIGEVEKYTNNLPGVLRSACFSYKSGGRTIISLAVEMQPGKEGTLKEARIFNALRSQLADFQVPTQIFFGPIVLSASATAKPNRSATAKLYSGASTQKRVKVDNRVFKAEDAVALMPEAGFDFPGMGKDLDASYPEVRDLFNRLNKVLQDLVTENDFLKPLFKDKTPDLREIMWGSQKDLLTSNFVIKQIAMHAYQVATSIVFEKKYGPAKYYAGKSMGISAALVAAGYIPSYEDGFRLTFEKSLYTSSASTKAHLRMGVVSGLTEEQTLEAIKVQKGKIVIRQGEKNFIVSLEVDLDDPEYSHRFQRITEQVKRIDQKAEFLDSRLEMASHDPRLAQEFFPEEWARLERFLNQLKNRVAPVSARKAKVISSLTNGFVPEEADELMRYIELEEFTPLDWKQVLKFANDAGIRHFIQLAMNKKPYDLNDNQKNGLIDKEARITKLSSNEEFDLADKGVGQVFEGKSYVVKEDDLNGYAYASDDWNFFHTNQKVASQTKHKGRIAHAPFTESTVLSALQDKFDGYTLTGSKMILAQQSVKPGDEIKPFYIIEEIKGDKQEELSVITGAKNQNGEILFEGHATLKKKLAEGEDASDRLTDEQAKANAGRVQSTEPGEAQDWKVGDKYYDANDTTHSKNQSPLTKRVTSEQYAQLKYLLTRNGLNPNFKGKDLLLAKSLLSFASFSFVKGYVHVENEIKEILQPINAGDQFTLETVITDVSGNLVTFSVKAINQNDDVVFTGYVQKMKEKIELSEEALTSDRPEFEKKIRTVIDRLVTARRTQMFPGHNPKAAEQAIAGNADQVGFDAEDASRPEMLKDLEKVMADIFSRIKTGTSSARFNIWRYFVKVGEKNKEKLIAAINNADVITADDLGREVGVDVLPESKAALNKYLSAGGFPNWFYRQELLKLFDLVDFQDKIVSFRSVSVRNAAVALFAQQMLNIIAPVGQDINVLILPKVDNEEDMRTADRVVTALGNEGILFQPLIEKAEGVVHAREIAKSSPRVVSLIYGLVDDVADTGGRLQNYGSRYQLFPQRQIIQAADENGIMSIGPITPSYDDSVEHEDEKRAALLGHHGKWVVNPGAKDHEVAFQQPDKEKLVARVMSHKGASQFAEGTYDLDKLKQNAKDQQAILKPAKVLKRNRELRYRTPVELTLGQLKEKGRTILDSDNIEAVILRNVDPKEMTPEILSLLRSLRAKNIFVTVTLDFKNITEDYLRNLMTALHDQIDALELTGDYKIDHVDQLTSILNLLEIEGKPSLNIHLNISTSTQLENLARMASVESYAGESRISTVIYNLPEEAIEGSHFKQAFDFYRQKPAEYFQEWDYKDQKFVPRQEKKKNAFKFFDSVGNNTASPEEAARLDQMSELLHYASVARLNMVYRANRGNKDDAYFEAMDAGNMGYHGMLIDADRLEEQAESVKRAMTPEKALIDEYLRADVAYYNQAKILGAGALLFNYTYGYSQTTPGLIDEATNQMFISNLRRAHELGILTSEQYHQLMSYGTERFFVKGDQQGQLVDLREGEDGWHYKQGDYTKVYKNNDESVVREVVEKRVTSSDSAMTATPATEVSILGRIQKVRSDHPQFGYKDFERSLMLSIEDRKWDVIKDQVIRLIQGKGIDLNNAMSGFISSFFDDIKGLKDKLKEDYVLSSIARLLVPTLQDAGLKELDIEEIEEEIDRIVLSQADRNLFVTQFMRETNSAQHASTLSEAENIFTELTADAAMISNNGSNVIQVDFRRKSTSVLERKLIDDRIREIRKRFVLPIQTFEAALMLSIERWDRIGEEIIGSLGDVESDAVVEEIRSFFWTLQYLDEESKHRYPISSLVVLLEIRLRAETGLSDSEIDQLKKRIDQLILSKVDKQQFITAFKKLTDYSVERSEAAFNALKSDRAVMGENSADQINNGGIDLNPASLNMQIQRDGKGVPLPLNLQPIENLNIEGFIPVIINTQPMTPAMLLSLADEKSADLVSNSADDLVTQEIQQKVILK